MRVSAGALQNFTSSSQASGTDARSIYTEHCREHAYRINGEKQNSIGSMVRSRTVRALKISRKTTKSTASTISAGTTLILQYE